MTAVIADFIQIMDTPQGNKQLCTREDAVAVVRQLRHAGHIAYFAGGCVRDELLGFTPKDYDVATDAEPDKVRKIFPQTQAVGAAFGVILVRQGKSVVEVATFRRDGPYSDGRRPDRVSFATAEEDAQRRDFTMNGLFFDPLENKVIDYVNGREDLAARRLRAIGDAGKRFEEDHLRMLRAVRFAARFGLRMDAMTEIAITVAAPRLKGISPERIAEELRLILSPPTRANAWPMLWKLGLGPVIFRLLTTTPAIKDRSIFLAVSPGKNISFGLALAAAVLEVWLNANADPRTLFARTEAHRCSTAMRKTLRISNEESDEMDSILEGLGPLLADAEPGIAIKKRFLARPTAANSRQLLAAMDAMGICSPRAKALAAEFAILEKTDFAPPPLLNGDHLTAAGMKPGPLFKRLLDAAYDAQLEGKISTLEEAMAFAKKQS